MSEAVTDNIKLPKMSLAFFDEFGNGADDRVHDYAREAVRMNAAPASWFAGWLVSNSEGDEEFINNEAALAGRHYKGGAPLRLEASFDAGNARLNAAPVPEIDYEALIAAAYKKNRNWAQGTNGCVAFAKGAEWFREIALAAAPEPQGVPEPADKPLADWEDPDVQLVYRMLADTEAPPNPEEHWEGYNARRIVAELRARQRVGVEGWRKLAETQGELIKTIKAVDDLDRKYGLDGATHPQQSGEQPKGRNCPGCKFSDSWGIASGWCEAQCAPTADGKGSNFQPLNGPSQQSVAAQPAPLDKETQTAKLLGLVDDLIESDPDRAERFIESVLARNALQKRLAEKKAAQPATRPDGMPASASERHLRRLLAVRVGMPNTYLDDGEAHGQEHGISIDFMREMPDDIDAKLRALNAARALAAQPEQERKPLSALVHSALNRAFVMGQNYWADADSESYKANKRSDVTRQKFNAMRDEVCEQVGSFGITKESP